MTNSLARRIVEHHEGRGSDFPAAYRCTKLIYHEHYSDIHEAIAREQQLKRWSRGKKIALITKFNPKWADLADDILGSEQ